jgi:ribosomal protein L40E
MYHISSGNPKELTTLASLLGVVLFSFNGMQCRAVTVPLTGRNTVTRHPCIMGLIDNLLCRKCGAEEEISGHVLRKCETLVTLRHNYLVSFFLDQKGV